MSYMDDNMVEFSGLDAEDDPDTLSFDEVAQDEAEYIESDMAEVELDDVSYQRKDDVNLEKDLSVTAFLAPELAQGILRLESCMPEEQEQLSKSIQALFDLLNFYGSPEALDHLTELVASLKDSLMPSAVAQVVDGLTEFSRIERLPLKDPDHLGEGPKQITLELQEQLLQNVSYNNADVRERIQPILDGFSDNPNFVDDARFKSLMAELTV